MPNPLSQQGDAARELLLGLLAFQNGFVGRESLLEAVRAWAADRDRPIGGHLVERGVVDPARLALLQALVDEHLKLHGGDPEKSLAALGSSVDPVMSDLSRAAGDDLQPSLALMGRGRTGSVREAPRPAGERYRILKLHAEGGLGRVYEAEDRELGRKVALKEIQPEKADRRELRSRFVLEAEINGGLQHPGIVPVYSLGHHDDGKPFYAMRFVEGASLRDAVARHHQAHPKPDPSTKESRDLLNRFLDVCNAVAFAHSRGVLHRDLKPHNVMIGNYGEALIIDWGLAKATGKAEPEAEGRGEATLIPPSGSAAEETRGVIGTPSYMSPEQAEGKVDELGPATDVYALGAILYHMLTGQPPFKGDGPDLTSRVIGGEFPPPRSLNPNVPATLQAVCLKAMARTPDSRYPTARALADDVARWMSDEPVSALRDPLLTRAARWARKHRVATAAVAAGLVVGLIASLAGLQRERMYAANLDRQRRRAEAGEKDAIAAVKRFSDVITAEPVLKDSPELKDLRTRLMKEPLSFYRTLRDRLEEDRDTRPASLARLGEACLEMGFLANEIGDRADALRVYREGLEIFQRLSDAEPGVAAYRRDLALTQFLTGNALTTTGQEPEAVKVYNAARVIQEQLVSEQPENLKSQYELAQTLNNLASTLHRMGRSAESLRIERSALDRLAALVQARPDHADYRIALAACHGQLGQLLTELRRSDEARKEYDASLSIARATADDHPDVAEYRNILALTHDHLGNFHRAVGRPTEAAREFESGLKIRQELIRAHPSVTQFQKGLSDAHSSLAALWTATRQWPKARAALDEALSVCQALADAHPSVPDFRVTLAEIKSRLGVVLYQTGKADEGRKLLQEARAIDQALSDSYPDSPKYRRSLAELDCDFGVALAAGSDRLAEGEAAVRRGISTLEELVARDPEEVEQIYTLALAQTNLAEIYSRLRRGPEAIRVLETALSSLRTLCQSHPEILHYQAALAKAHEQLAAVFQGAGMPGEAIAQIGSAAEIRRKLAKAVPDDPRYPRDLGQSLSNLGGIQAMNGRPADAVKSLEESKGVWERLAQDSPEDLEFQFGLANCCHNLGAALSDSGQPARGMELYEQALPVWEALLRRDAGSAGVSSRLGNTLMNMAVSDLNNNRFAKALELARRGLDVERRALADNPNDLATRNILENGLKIVHAAAKGLGRADEAEEALKELTRFRADDPRGSQLDSMIAAVAEGRARPHPAARMGLALRAHETGRYALAARFWDETIAADPSLAADRRTQACYSAACAAALAASGQGRDVPPPDDAERARLRAQALGWLRYEVDAWKPVLKEAAPEQLAWALRHLRHWGEDPDLAGVRDPDALAKLPEAERKEWQALWDDVKRLIAGTSPRDAAKKQP